MVGSNGSIAGTLLSNDSEDLKLLDPVEGEGEVSCLLLRSDGAWVLFGDGLSTHSGLMMVAAGVGLCCWRLPSDMVAVDQRYE